MCGSGSVVERCLAKANVASSSLVFRSNEKTVLMAQFCQQVSKHFALTLVFSFHDQTKIALCWRFCRDYSDSNCSEDNEVLSKGNTFFV